TRFGHDPSLPLSGGRGECSQRATARAIAQTSPPATAATPTTAATAAAGLRAANTRALAMPRFDAFSTRRGTLPLISMAASAALSSARADATGSVIPAGTAVRGRFVSEFVITGILHDSNIGRDGLSWVLAPKHLAELH